MVEYGGCLVVFFIGLYCVMVKRNIYKIIVGLLIMEFAVDLFLVLLGYRHWGTTMIILAVTLVSLAVLTRAQKIFSSLDVNEMKELNG
ncbi:MAG: NADH-quinone oxidoreductase subunit K [Candidatus Margulisbacteria bacterium]|nr:NADH-quinone oxidoreductase subunit K [Candidatus Margulisiibacteriota bacterium]MBU1617713.1 NADH-quinone oxidoreductase subunit K [Candidatus Margulisiibacteriota bacterium]